MVFNICCGLHVEGLMNPYTILYSYSCWMLFHISPEEDVGPIQDIVLVQNMIRGKLIHICCGEVGGPSHGFVLLMKKFISLNGVSLFHNF